MRDNSASSRILIAGIGNIFMGDDAFGSEVARRLARQDWPDGVRVTDFGIRGIDLVYSLLEGYDWTILIDATCQGGPPGTLYTIEPDLSELQEVDAEGATLDGHTMDPLKVLRTVHAMGGSCRNVLLVGCEPAHLGGEEGALGLSPLVEAAVDEACRIVRSITNEFQSSGTIRMGPQVLKTDK